MTRRELLSLVSAMTVGAAANTPRMWGDAVAPSPGRIANDPRAQREDLYALLGDLPDRQRRLGARLIGEEERDGYLLETLELDLNGFEPVPALLAKPKKLQGKAPAVLFNHSHSGDYPMGKREFIEGRNTLQDPPYAKLLTDLGYVGLCIDAWVFGERSHTGEMDMFKAMLWQGHVLWGMMVYDSIRALDYLVSRPDVDASRIATLGLSMGSTMAWWLAALDERITVTVDICCLTEFHTLLREKGLGGHGIYYYVPDLLKHFTTADINALIAPRAHLSLAGTRDKLTPVAGLDIIDTELKRVYAEHGAPEKWRLIRYDEGHKETAAGRREIMDFLKAHLR